MGFQDLPKETRVRLGRLGGINNVTNNGKEHMAKIGEKGGYTTLEKHGREHLSRIGKLHKKGGQ